MTSSRIARKACLKLRSGPRGIRRPQMYWKEDTMESNAKVNVLIVDNDDLILGKLQQLLEDAGFNATTTWSGHEALGLLRSGVFDVLLVDDYLPDLHSHNFLERVNCLPIQPSIVVMHNEPPKPDDLRCYQS